MAVQKGKREREDHKKERGGGGGAPDLWTHRGPRETNRTIIIVSLLAVFSTPVQGTNYGPGPPRPLPQPDSVILGLQPLQVPLGGLVLLDPQLHLQTRVFPGDHCQVMVLDQNRLVPPRPGTLHPLRFPCEFRRGQVSYTHHGSRTAQRDWLRLQLRYDTPTDTLVLPLTLEVELTSDPKPGGAPVVVDTDGLSNPIDGRSLGMHPGAGGGALPCKITSLVGSFGLPKYGSLVGDVTGGQVLDCDDFINMEVRYKLSPSSPSSPILDYVPLLVEHLDRKGRVQQREHIQVTVKVREGVVNSKPRPSFLSLMLLEVNQFIMTAVTPETLAAEDQESVAEELVFHILSPPTTVDGYVISTDDPTRPIVSFCQGDITALKVAFVPPQGDSDRERVVHLELEVEDGDGARSERFTLMVLVKPMNTLAPVVTGNQGLTLFEGQSRPLSVRISDEDDLWEVRLWVRAGLRHGALRVGGAADRKWFTAAELHEGKVVYEHDGSETFSDNILFRMKDGQGHEVDFLFLVTVVQLDDEAPVVNVNTGLVVHRKQIVLISSRVLSATDVDSEDSSLTFTLLPPASPLGVVVLRQRERPEGAGLEGWVFLSSEGVFERAVTSWTQKDIQDGRLFYRPTGPPFPHSTNHQLKFYVHDDNVPPNQSEEVVLEVMVQSVDDVPPEVLPGSTLSVSVLGGRLTPLTRDCLLFTDLGSDDRNILYTLTSPPREAGLPPGLPQGSLVLTDSPEVAVSEFTQEQVNHLKISYLPPAQRLLPGPRTLHISFTVKDQAGNSAPGSLTVLLLPGEDTPPPSRHADLNIHVKDMYVLTRADVGVQDTGVDDIMAVVTQTPALGVLMCAGAELTAGGSFHLSDIDGGVVVYVHRGDQPGNDVIKVKVSDGRRENLVTLVTLQIEVLPALAPLLPPPPPPPGELNITLQVNETGETHLSGRDLPLTHTDDITVMLLVDCPPRFGVIRVHGEPSDRLSLRNVIDGSVAYVHSGEEVGPLGRNDSFVLTVIGRWVVGGNRVERVCVEVCVLPVDSVPPVLNAGEVVLVTEGGRTAVTNHNVRLEDRDTPPERLLCSVLTPPTFGFLEVVTPAPGSEKSRSGIATTTFSQAELVCGSVFYRQSVHRGTEPLEDRLTIHCSDGYHQSDPLIVPVVIVPANDEAPQLFWRELVVEEGMSLAVDEPLLSARDLDIPADTLLFRVKVQPLHGRLVQHLPTGTVSVETFTLEQVRLGGLLYEHGGSEEAQDNFTLVVTDGRYNTEATLLVLVLPLDDETPRVTLNTGLDLLPGQSRPLTPRVIKVTDLDSDDPSLTFVLRQEPGEGWLQRRGGSGRVNITVGMNFTQREVDEGVVWYTHSGRHGGGRDLFRFDVTDGTNPLIDRYFYITVAGDDIVHPVVVNRGVELTEGGRVVLTTDILSTSDLNSPDEHLTFTLTRGPSKGHLEVTDRPGVSVTTFTQLQLAGSKVLYIHTTLDEDRHDSFDFQVTDGRNVVYRTFRVSITDVDNKRPILRVRGLTLVAGTTKLVTPFELGVEDEDTPDWLVEFTVTRPPLWGHLLYNRTRTASSFTRLDLKENRISYQNQGSTQDSLLFIVTDGTQPGFHVFPDTVRLTVIPQTLQFHILPEEGEPRLVLKRPVTSLTVLQTGSPGLVITNKVLKAVKKQNLGNQGRMQVQGQTAGTKPRQNITFWVTKQPKWGVLINTALGNSSISTFTQDDVDQMKIIFVLPDGMSSSSDIFFFSLLDQKGQPLPSQPFQLFWSWVSLETAPPLVDESCSYMQVTLRRRGCLDDTAFISINIRDITTERGQDYQATPQRQVQFNPGQSLATWKLRIHADQVYERSESFLLVLSDPVMTLLETPTSITVEIVDPGDESTVSLPQGEVRVGEDAGEVLIPIRRSGDLSKDLMVTCFTVQGSARGSSPGTLLSFSDYISRPQDRGSALSFLPGQEEGACRVVVIDDSLYEGEESFLVVLSNAMGGRVGAGLNVTRVVILPHTPDDPQVYFGQSEFSVDEGCGHLEVPVWRTGTDLSHNASVTVRSRTTKPGGAEAGLDYIGISRNVDFPPSVTMVMVKVAILDDLGSPVLEGAESFQLVLSMPSNATLGTPHLTIITINDSMSDLPRVQFKEAELTVDEADGRVVAVVTRHGDLSHASEVRCYTRQSSAQVMMDYEERPDSEDSIISFLPGQREQQCVVILVDDSEHEEEEEFRLVLRIPSGQSRLSLLLGQQQDVVIHVTDEKDRSVISFSETRYTVKEPVAPGEVAVVRVAVRRLGDLSQVSVVRVHTRDGSAHSGLDYVPFSKEMVFSDGQSEHVLEVQVLFDQERETRETFTLHLTPDHNMVAHTQVIKALVSIEDGGAGGGGVTFPAPPMVVSLTVYDNPPIDPAPPNPPTGYPLVCLTVCDPLHPAHPLTSPHCLSEGLNSSLTQYRWLLGPPGGLLKGLEAGPLAGGQGLLLDQLYLQPGVRVQCCGRAVSSEGRAGQEVCSPLVEVSTTEGMCPPSSPGVVGAEPYSATLRYTGPDDPAHPNLLRLTVTMAHVDGLIPLVSTRPLSSLSLTLTQHASLQDHRCSNLQGPTLQPNTTHLGLTCAGLPDSGRGPLLRSPTAQRGGLSLGFYRSLDLDACVWSFTGHYSIGELLSDCGGTVERDGQVQGGVQSYVSLRVPLYVTYLHSAPSAPEGWVTFDLRSDLRLTFTYETSILWRDGIATPPDAPLQGSLYPTSMRINSEGRLVVTFRTQARFRGHFILSHPGVQQSSGVQCEDHPSLLFTLSLLDPTHSTHSTHPTHSTQTWSFISQLAIRDYSGSYLVRLIPCLVPERGAGAPPTCHPRPLLSFSLHVRLQQVSDPGPLEVSLNTALLLLSNREMWLSEGLKGPGEEREAAFSQGSVIFGRVMVDPVHRLGNHFLCHIQQVFLCTPADGYVPKYRPGNNEYGCLADSPSLLHRLKLLDKAQPQSQVLELGGIPFQALLAGDTPGAEALVSQPDADGFSLSSDPLFQEGHEWYIHVVYTVHSSSHGNSYHGVSKQSLHQHSANSRGRVSRAALEDNQDQGTNLQYVPLIRAPLLGQSRADRPLEDLELQEERGLAGEGSPGIEATSGVGWQAVVVLVVVVCVGGLGFYLRRPVRSDKEQKHPGNHSSSSSSSSSCSAFQSKEGRSWRTGGGVSTGSSEV